MAGATFLLLLRRGATLTGSAPSATPLRAFRVVEKQSYTAGASATDNHAAGALREQTYHAGASVTEAN